MKKNNLLIRLYLHSVIFYSSFLQEKLKSTVVPEIKVWTKRYFCRTIFPAEQVLGDVLSAIKFCTVKERFASAGELKKSILAWVSN